MSEARTLKTLKSFDELVKDRENIQVASFDVGWKAFAWSVGEWDVPFLQQQREKFFGTRYKKDRKKGTKIYGEVLHAVALNEKRVDIDVYDISSDDKKLDIQVRLNLFSLLQEKKYLWDPVSIVVIEQQFCTSFGGAKKQKTSEGTNMDAVKLSECLMSWMLMQYGSTKSIVFVPTASKTNILGAPKMPKKLDRKKWVLAQVLSWAKEKGDEGELEKFEESKIVFDMADSKAQGIATVFKYVVTAE
ncbi:putative RuvC-like Holliday junction resolvase [Insectomime virus]|uniref:Putative RuvC-like Holliday junction resolvase n=1 Tax=Tunisvirus fontaine2 TaxID=1421067 RepID=V9SDP4_9VIRU|nr:putative RuvC-like Holliday junction resolvase [Tunisvirus fontaine2]AHA46090.1 putative RuvC-like Holliday junction resolvase [Insectomime virus]AHC54845.1 putative RuvC-like Holliday junction resolvase [Tunisvirus fontaine2]